MEGGGDRSFAYKKSLDRIWMFIVKEAPMQTYSWLGIQLPLGSGESGASCGGYLCISQCRSIFERFEKLDKVQARARTLERTIQRNTVDYPLPYLSTSELWSLHTLRI